MADLLVIGFDSEERAEEVRRRLLAMQKEYLIQLGDAVVAVKRPDGNVKLKQLVNPVAAGAMSGVIWGSLIGLLFMMPLAGAAVGAASGALGGKLADFGIDDDFMREASKTLHSGDAALFLLIRKMTTEKVMAELKGSGGRILRSSFDDAKEAELRDALQDAHSELAAAVDAGGDKG